LPVEIENRFTVTSEPAVLWATLLDVERVAPCMPGAELTETVDDRTWKGTVKVRVGPVSLSFAGIVTIEDRDDETHRVTLRAQGMEQKGKGTANATVTSWLEPDDAGTAVIVRADVQLTGAVAQLSRGLLPEVSRRLTDQFAECLRTTMMREAAEPTAETTPVSTEAPAADRPTPPRAARDEAMPTSTRAQAAPISGIRLGLASLWSALMTILRRLFSKGR
jgi:carbon monoxide dehydrogenase subunit G